MFFVPPVKLLVMPDTLINYEKIELFHRCDFKNILCVDKESMYVHTNSDIYTSSRARSETRAARATRATRANIFIAKTMSEYYFDLPRAQKTQKSFAVQDRPLFKVYPSRPSFRSGPMSKNEKSGNSGKRQKTIRQVNPNNSQQKKLLQTQVDSYYDLPSTQRRINTLIP